MGKTSNTKVLKRQGDLREGKPLGGASVLGRDGNRLSRRSKLAGKNPHHAKGGENWRRSAQAYGCAHPGARTTSVVDASAVVASGKNKRRPVPCFPRAKDLEAERRRVRKPPQHTVSSSGPQQDRRGSSL